MIVTVETQEHAADWIKKIVGEDFAAVVVLRQNFMSSPSSLRDRTADAYRMMVGFGEPGASTKEKTVLGKELFEAGWDICGAQLCYNFKFVWKQA